MNDGVIVSKASNLLRRSKDSFGNLERKLVPRGEWVEAVSKVPSLFSCTDILANSNHQSKKDILAIMI